MDLILYVVAGMFGGLIGGMGMGGGTLLIPLLTIFYKVSQHSAQAINLIAFIPMSIVALIIHFKNKLIETKNILLIIISGIITCVASCFLANVLDGDILTKLFGGFLVVLAIWQFISTIKQSEEWFVLVAQDES